MKWSVCVLRYESLGHSARAELLLGMVGHGQSGCARGRSPSVKELNPHDQDRRCR
jgi:hypothetical protein